LPTCWTVGAQRVARHGLPNRLLPHLALLSLQIQPIESTCLSDRLCCSYLPRSARASIKMPYCNRCGDAFGGSGWHCRNCDNSTSNALIAPFQRTFNQNSLSRPALFPPPGVISPETVSKITFEKNGSVVVEMNPNRAQCSCCRKWFLNSAVLGRHRREAPSGCREHNRCFGHSDNFVHAQRHQHSRCFVPGCRYTYGLEDNSSNEQIMRHVWDKHKPISDEDRNRQERLVANVARW